MNLRADWPAQKSTPDTPENPAKHVPLECPWSGVSFPRGKVGGRRSAPGPWGPGRGDAVAPALRETTHFASPRGSGSTGSCVNSRAEWPARKRTQNAYWQGSPGALLERKCDLGEVRSISDFSMIFGTFPGRKVPISDFSMIFKRGGALRARVLREIRFPGLW